MKKNIKFFNYDQYWDDSGEKIRNKLREREQIFIDWIKPGSAVLDIACGNSLLPFELSSKKGCIVEAFDISPKVIQEQQVKRINAQVRDLTDKNFKLEKKYDYIIASEILEHLAYPEVLLDKIKNNARFFLISVPNSAFYRFRFKLFFFGRFFVQWAYHPAEHLRYWSHEDFLDWLDSSGFRIIQSRASNGLDIGPLKFYEFWPNLFGHQICYLVELKTT